MACVTVMPPLFDFRDEHAKLQRACAVSIPCHGTHMRGYERPVSMCLLLECFLLFTTEMLTMQPAPLVWRISAAT